MLIFLAIAALAIVVSLSFAADDTSADGTAPVVGDTFTVNKITYEVTSASSPTTVTVSTCDADLTVLMIPNSVSYQPDGSSYTYTYNVTAIADYAFKDHTKIEQVSIGTNVKTIGQYAFYGCSNITGTISSSATSVGAYAFYRCSKVETISLNSVTAVLEHTFDRCSLLATVGLNKATSIGSYAFYYCVNLDSCYCSKVTDVSDHAFAYCYKLTDVSIPSKVKTIGAEAYWYCYALEEPCLEDCDDLTSIGIMLSTTVTVSQRSTHLHLLLKLVTVLSQNVIILPPLVSMTV